MPIHNRSGVNLAVKDSSGSEITTLEPGESMVQFPTLNVAVVLPGELTVNDGADKGIDLILKHQGRLVFVPEPKLTIKERFFRELQNVILRRVKC